MGLHPRAIAAVLFVLLELLDRGYRICLSTHSTHVLDLVWALQILRKTKAPPERLLDLFGVQHDKHFLTLASKALGRRASVYYFDDETKQTHDISTLDPGDPDEDVSTWRGLTQFASQIGEMIAKQVNGVSAK